jgi:predicted nuclease with TOPRIM domain
MDKFDYLEEIHKLNRELEEFRKAYFRLEDENKRLKEKVRTLTDNAPQLRLGFCKECGASFEYSHTGREKKFCSNACKQANYRFKRKFKALGL